MLVRVEEGWDAVGQPKLHSAGNRHTGARLPSPSHDGTLDVLINMLQHSGHRKARSPRRSIVPVLSIQAVERHHSSIKSSFAVDRPLQLDAAVPTHSTASACL